MAYPKLRNKIRTRRPLVGVCGGGVDTHRAAKRTPQAAPLLAMRVNPLVATLGGLDLRVAPFVAHAAQMLRHILLRETCQARQANDLVLLHHPEVARTHLHGQELLDDVETFRGGVFVVDGTKVRVDHLDRVRRGWRTHVPVERGHERRELLHFVLDVPMHHDLETLGLVFAVTHEFPHRDLEDVSVAPFEKQRGRRRPLMVANHGAKRQAKSVECDGGRHGACVR